jgi:hypothetical protein
MVLSFINAVLTRKHPARQIVNGMSNQYATVLLKEGQ